LMRSFENGGDAQPAPAFKTARQESLF